MKVMKTNVKLIVLVFTLMCVFSAPAWPQVGKAAYKAGMAVTKATTHYVATGAYNRQLNTIRQNSDIYRLQGVSVPHDVVMKNSIRRNQETEKRLRRFSDQIRKCGVISPTKKSVKPSPAKTARQ